MIEAVLGAHAFEKSEITVIGAGPAGLLTAYRLKKAALNVKVIEARSRSGGRLFSAPSIQAEFGAWSLANGGKPEMFQALAEELGLEIDYWQAPFKRLGIVSNQLSDITYRFIQSYDNDPRKARSILEAIILVSKSGQEVLDNFYPDEPFLKDFTERLLWGYFGSRAAELSAKLYKESIIQLCLGGMSDVYKQGPQQAPLTRVKGGNDLFTKKLAEFLRNDITLNKPLTAIARSTGNRLRLLFEDGAASETDLLVLALPVSAYKNLTIEEGLVPQDRLESIRSVCPGSITKILIPALGTARPPGYISTNDYGAAMSEHEKFLTLYWRTPFTLDACKAQVASIAQALKWDLPTKYIHVETDDLHKDYPQDAVYIIDWVHAPYINGSFCAFSPANDRFVRAEKIEGIATSTLFKPSGSIYFVGEAAGTSTPPGSLAAAFESAEHMASLIKQRLLFLYSNSHQDVQFRL